MVDPRIIQYLKAAKAMKNGNFSTDIPLARQDEIGQLGNALADLGKALEEQFETINLLSKITEKINAGFTLDEILNYAFESLQPIIPYDRIGVSLLENEGRVVRAYWVRSKSGREHKIKSGYEIPIGQTSLEEIIKTGKPRILSNLMEIEDKYTHHSSGTTSRILQDGIRSSLTFPLIAMGKPIGFMFFSSARADAYKNVHVELFQQIAGQLAVIIEKGRLYQREAELNLLKSKFLGMAVHDLRSPLTVGKGYLSLFLEGFLGEIPEAQKEFLKIIDRTYDSMLGLINDLLDMSAIQSGQLKIEFQEVDLAEYLQSWYATSSLLAGAKSIDLELELARVLPKIFLDPVRIQQVLDNLLTNAIKFSYPDTVIKVQAKVSKDTVEISVQDQGQGIPEDEKSRLFQEFSHLSVRPTSDEKSTGLGLAIVKRLVEAHKGRVWAESKEGAGSTFTFSLPLKKN